MHFQGGPFNFAVRIEYLLIAGLNNIRIFSLPIVNLPPKLLETFPVALRTIEITFLENPTDSFTPQGIPKQPPAFVAIALAMLATGIRLFTISRDTTDRRFSIHLTQEYKNPYKKEQTISWSLINTGATGGRVLWISRTQTYLDEPMEDRPPQLMCGVLGLKTESSSASGPLLSDLSLIR